MTAGKRNTKLVQMQAQELEVHPHAQRAINTTKLKSQRAKFDLDAIGVIHAVQYMEKGTLATFVIDGHHRVTNLMALGLGEWPVDVMIHTDAADDARAHQLFLELNDRANVSAYSKFQNAVLGGMHPAMEIATILRSRGLVIGAAAGDGRVRCVNALMTAFEYDAGVGLAAALDTILATWGRGADGLDGHVIQGLSKVYTVFNTSIARTAMIRTLGKFAGGAIGLVSAARGRRAAFYQKSIGQCVAEVAVDAYNVKRTSHRLLWPEARSTKSVGGK